MNGWSRDAGRKDSIGDFKPNFWSPNPAGADSMHGRKNLANPESRKRVGMAGKLWHTINALWSQDPDLPHCASCSSRVSINEKQSTDSFGIPLQETASASCGGMNLHL